MTATAIGTDKEARQVAGLNSGDFVVAYIEDSTGGFFTDRARLVLNQRDFF